MANTQQAAKYSFDPQQYLQVKEFYTQNPILFKIIQISDISKSRLNQLDEWQEHEDPNSVSVDRVSKSNSKKSLSNKVIREVNINSENDTMGNTNKSGSIYKLILKDNFDNFSYAYEYNDRLPFLRQAGSTGTPLAIPLGGKLIVNKGTLVMNGSIMLKTMQCQYLGMDESHKEFADKLNSGIVAKQIALLKKELSTMQDMY